MNYWSGASYLPPKTESKSNLSLRYRDKQYLFEWYKTSLNEVSVVPTPQKPTCTCCPKQHFRHSKLLCSIKSEGHDTISHNTGHRRARRGGRIIELRDEVAKGSQAVLGDGITDWSHVLDEISITWWEAIWDRLKTKIWDAIKIVGALRPEQTPVVVLSVDKSDEKTSVVKQFCYLQWWVYMALRWIWDAHSMWFIRSSDQTHLHWERESFWNGYITQQNAEVLSFVTLGLDVFSTFKLFYTRFFFNLSTH